MTGPWWTSSLFFLAEASLNPTQLSGALLLVENITEFYIVLWPPPLTPVLIQDCELGAKQKWEPLSPKAVKEKTFSSVITASWHKTPKDETHLSCKQKDSASPITCHHHQNKLEYLHTAPSVWSSSSSFSLASSASFSIITDLSPPCFPSSHNAVLIISSTPAAITFWVSFGYKPASTALVHKHNATSHPDS